MKKYKTRVSVGVFENERGGSLGTRRTEQLAAEKRAGFN